MNRTTPLRMMALGLIVIMNLAGCATFRPSPGEQILGRWEASVGGFPVTVAYGPQTVTVEGADPVSYSLVGDELTVAGDETAAAKTVRHISFPARDEMVQRDPLTGAETRFVRVGE